MGRHPLRDGDLVLRWTVDEMINAARSFRLVKDYSRSPARLYCPTRAVGQTA